MLEEGRISPSQLAILIVITIIATAIIFLPAIAAKHAGQGAWISTLWAAGGGAVVAALVLALGRRFPNQNLAEALGEITAAPAGRMLALVYALWFIHINSIVIREFGEFLQVAFFPETPLVVILATLIFTAVFAVRGGIEVLARVAGIIFCITYPLFFLMIILSWFGEFNPQRLLPLWQGAYETWQGAVSVFIWMGEVVAVSFLYPYLNKREGVSKAVLGGLALVGVTLAVTVVASISMFGAPEVGRQVFPTILLIRTVRAAKIIERQEPVLMFIWVSGVLIKTSVFFYISSITMSQSLGLKDYRAVVLPQGVLLVVLSMLLFESSPQLQAFLEFTAPPYAVVFELIIPISVLALSLILPRRVKQNA